MKSKFHLVMALVLALTISGGVYAYTFTTASGTINIAEPTGDVVTSNATATQPDWNSILPPQDSGIETLRPNAAGTYSQGDPIGDSPNYLCVDEVTPDEDTTYIRTWGSATELDTYNIADHSEGVGDITSVTVYIRSRVTSGTHDIETAIRTYGTNYFGGLTSTSSTSYINISANWATNPYTDSAWTWDEIDALEAGVRQYDLGPGYPRTTQVYVEVTWALKETCGEVPTGDLFTITPNTIYTGDLMAKVYLANTGNLTKAYQYLNMKVFLESSVEAGETPNYRLLTLQNGEVAFTMEELQPIEDTWTQTSQTDFESGNLTNLDTWTSPDDVMLDTFADNVTDTYDNEDKIASSANVTVNVSDGQVKLTAGGGAGSETLRPDADGDDTLIDNPPSGPHWTEVDDVISDNWSTYVSTNSTSYQRDLYSIPDHSTGSGAINSVTVYFRVANAATAEDSTTYAIAYQGQGTDTDGFLKTVEVDNDGQITDTVIDTLEFDAADGVTPNMIQISGNVYAIAYEGVDADGFLKTVEVANDGQITDPVIDTLEFDTSRGSEPDIIHVSGDVYAIAHTGAGADGWVTTVEIDSNGNITDTIIDNLEFDATDCDQPDIIHVSGDVYAIAYNGPGSDGWLATVEIANNGQITDTVIDTLEFNTSSGVRPSIVHVSGDVYAIAYQGPGSDGFLATVEIANNGQITDTVIDTLEYNTSRGSEPDIIHVSGDVYAIAHRGAGNDGWLATVEIATNGQITDPVIDTLEFDTVDGWEPSIAHVSGDVYAIAYRGADEDGWLATVEIATNGQITNTVIDTLEYDIADGVAPNIIFVPHVPGNVYARAAIKTGGTVHTGSEESTDNDTFVTESYQWTTNPDTGSDWTWDEIDALQIGVELRVGDATDSAACTQVYVVVNYTAYYPTGTLTSTNLLSGETVDSIDTFGYNASAIPSGTSLKVQFSTDNTTWYNAAGTPGGWDTLSEGTDNIDLSGLGWSGPNFYYHMLFTSDGSDTPVLDEISVIFYLYYTSGDLTSSSHDNGYDLDWDWGTISFTINEPSTTDIVFQIRTAATEGELSSATWYGPTGTSDNYTTTPTDVNPVHDGDRWIQYKAYFSGPGDSTPTLSDVSITYSAQAAIYIIEVIGGGYCLVSDDTAEWDTGWTITPELYCEVTPR